MTDIPEALAKYHAQQSSLAIKIYVDGLSPGPLAAEWRQMTRTVRKAILKTLIDTNGLRDVYGTLVKTGRHLLVLRHLFAPPISQDQLKLIAPLYPKGAEKRGSKLKADAAKEFSDAFALRRDKFLTPWLDTNAAPTRRQVKRLLDTVTPMISSQIFNTVRRNRLSDEQEVAVEAILVASGWAKVASSKLIGTKDLDPGSYMRKTRCRSSKTATKEVDIACGVNSNLILAMECKVSNDGTNSVKRVSDVMDKVKSWNESWADFIQTAALLQGVILYKDVARMLASDVQVFWSHDLDRFSSWLKANK